MSDKRVILDWTRRADCGKASLGFQTCSRCHYLLRTVPPSQSRQYAVGHDAGMMRAMESVLGGIPGDGQQQETAHRLASLPMGGMDPVCGKDGPGCLLGVVGRFAPHDLGQFAWFG